MKELKRKCYKFTNGQIRVAVPKEVRELLQVAENGTISWIINKDGTVTVTRG